MTTKLFKEYGVKKEVTYSVDRIQREFSCCGSNSFLDWRSVKGGEGDPHPFYLRPADDITKRYLRHALPPCRPTLTRFINKDVRGIGAFPQIPFCDVIYGSEVKRVRVAFPPSFSRGRTHFLDWSSVEVELIPRLKVSRV